MFDEKYMGEMIRNGGFEAFPSDYNISRTWGVNLQCHDLVLGESPSSTASLPFEYSPSSSFSNGFCSSDGGSSRFSTQIPITPFVDGQRHFMKNMNDGLFDDSGLCENLYRMSVSDEENNVTQINRFKREADGFGSRFVDGFLGLNGTIHHNVDRCALYDGLYNASSGRDGYRCPPHEVSLYGDDNRSRLLGLQDEGSPKGFSAIAHNLSNDLGRYNNHRNYLLEQRKKYEQRWTDTGIPLQNHPINISPCLNDASLNSQQCGLDFSEDRLFSSSEMMLQPKLSFNMNNVSISSSMLDENWVPQSLLSVEGAGKVRASTFEDSFIIQGTSLKCAVNNMRYLSKHPKKSSHNEIGTQEKDLKLKNNVDQNAGLLTSLVSISEVYGSVYLMAKDQNGCRFLQRSFDEGSILEVTVIFNEVIDHVVELMMDPFGNYFIQKLLEVCSEEQRMQIVVMMISKPGQLVIISLNTYGTRVVQKLIETLRIKQQISLVKSALKLGFLVLVRDMNGNHVIQRCLQCLSAEDNKFIFNAATKFCVEIATHRHGCCVLQRCISHSVGPQRDKLIIQISRNSLLLAQDPFGNYVVQYIIEQKIPSLATSNMLSQFRGHYIQLSTQKFSSHVVEKCLKHCSESRSEIIREFISAPYFDQLLLDPFANYVIQSALVVIKGPLRSCLVEALRAHSSLRTSPYCKRIFSKNLLKKL